MSLNDSSRHVTATPPAGAPDGSRLASCPGCHTAHRSLTQEMLDAGRGWRCERCGQRWDAGRLAIVTAYEAWCAVHDEPTPPLSTIEQTTGAAAAIVRP